MMKNQTTLQKQNKAETKMSPVRHSMILFLLHLLVMAFLSAHLGNFVNAAADSKELFEDTGSLQDVDSYLNDPSTSNIMEKLKRSWKSLQGSWGKRSNEGTMEDDYKSEQPEWNLIKPSENSNEHDSEPSDTEPEEIKYYVMYTSHPNLLATAVGATATSNGNDLAAMEPSDSNFEKKSWKNMNVAWGKRRSAVWNKFRGAWGKREPAWNNLKGMWGKRSPKDWKKLQSAWGKRSQQENRK